MQQVLSQMLSKYQINNIEDKKKANEAKRRNN